uniref:cytochrome P450 family protein n=1 Tax=Streptomyces sp. TRM64462 TaxID=2741726 RepID=UPI0015869808
MESRQCPFATSAAHSVPVLPVVIDPAGTDIQGEADRLRERGPAVPVVLPGGVRAWAVAGAAAAKRVMADPRVSKDPVRHWPAWTSGEVPADWPLAMWVSIRSMFTAYGADHTRLRKLVAGAFTMRRTTDLRPAVERVAEELLDRIQADHGPDRPFDLRRAYAGPLPARVVCELFGVPDDMRDDLCEVFDRLFDTASDAAAVQDAAGRLYAMLTRLVAAKRATPGDDLTSGLLDAQRAAAQEEGAVPLAEQELLDTLVHLLSAGYETTVNLLDHAVHALLTHPGQLELIRTGRAEWADAVEETLRWQPSAANYMLRYAVEDIDLDGVVVPKGDAILVSAAGAGRDPEVHGPDADRFDITRPTRARHVSFGHGAHHCLGAPLARMEAAIGLEALFRRFPRLALAVPSEELRPLSSFISNGHRELPLLPGRAAGTTDAATDAAAAAEADGPVARIPAQAAPVCPYSGAARRPLAA